MKNIRLIVLLVLAFTLCKSTFSQTTAFTFQGKLNSSGSTASGNHDFEFALFDAASGGVQLGSTVALNSVAVTDGIFTVNLDFGSQFPGANRFLEIRVRQTGGGAFTTLSPRQPVNSVPYSIKSLASETAVNATNSTNAVTATNSLQLGGIAASQYIVQGAAAINAGSRFDIGGERVLSLGGSNTSTFLGRNTGTAGSQNSLFGANAGSANTANFNSFFGFNAGTANTTGFSNAFFGAFAGEQNTAGDNNAFFGTEAGRNNTGEDNTFVGAAAGLLNTSGERNAFFGRGAGLRNTTASNNSFFGNVAGEFNTTGGSNSFFGNAAGRNTTAGFGNSFFGANAGQANTTAIGNSYFGTGAGRDSTGGSNSFFGQNAGSSNVAGSQNSFFGASAGSLGSGSRNSFFGTQSGFRSDGDDNSFFGNIAGDSTTSGSRNSFFGNQAGDANTIGGDNSFFGNLAGTDNVGGNGNVFLGAQAGRNNTNGTSNTYVGTFAGEANSLGTNNSYFGTEADGSLNGLVNATAIGSRAFVARSNALVLGSINLVNGATADTTVGIGTTDPRQKLSVAGSGIGSTNFSLFNTLADKGVQQEITDDGRWSVRIMSNSGNSLSSPRLLIDANGLVGINDFSPSARLDINAGNGNILLGDAGCAGTFTGIGFGSTLQACDNYSLAGNGTDTLVNRPTGGSISFRENNSSQMTIEAGGNVGIGATAPVAKLHVLGSSSSANTPLAIIQTSGTDIPLYFKLGAAERARIRTNDFGNLVFATVGGSEQDMFFRAGGDSAGDTDIFIDSATGNVGINTTAPDQQLSVNGNASKTGGASWLTFSDERLKNIKGRFTPGLSAVMRLQPVRYSYKTDNTLGIAAVGENIGFSAQEVEQVIPEAVTKNGQGYRMINNDPIILAMLNAIKEQQTQIDRQQSQIQALILLACERNKADDVCTRSRNKD